MMLETEVKGWEWKDVRRHFRNHEKIGSAGKGRKYGYLKGMRVTGVLSRINLSTADLARRKLGFFMLKILKLIIWSWSHCFRIHRSCYLIHGIHTSKSLQSWKLLTFRMLGQWLTTVVMQPVLVILSDKYIFNFMILDICTTTFTIFGAPTPLSKW